MNSDRELLELAAKAAGVKILSFGEEYLMIESSARGMRGWSPLLDDGDALRLSVKLNIEIRFHLAGSVPGVSACCAARHNLPVVREPWEPASGNKPGATRRAIVRAAAEIGKAMP